MRGVGSGRRAGGRAGEEPWPQQTTDHTVSRMLGFSSFSSALPSAALPSSALAAAPTGVMPSTRTAEMSALAIFIVFGRRFLWSTVARPSAICSNSGAGPVFARGLDPGGGPMPGIANGGSPAPLIPGGPRAMPGIGKPPPPPMPPGCAFSLAKRAATPPPPPPAPAFAPPALLLLLLVDAELDAADSGAAAGAVAARFGRLAGAGAAAPPPFCCDSMAMRCLSVMPTAGPSLPVGAGAEEAAGSEAGLGAGSTSVVLGAGWVVG